MRKVASLSAVIALVASAAFSGEGNVRRNSRGIPDRYIVVLETSADTDAVAITVRNLKGRIRHTYRGGLKGFALDMSEANAQTLAADARVQFVEQDSTVSAAATTWGLDRIDQRYLPLNGVYVSGGTGAGVSVYIVDTGIFGGHVDFGGRVAEGFSAFADGSGAKDCNGHGTHVAGLVGGSLYGVAKAATLIPVRVLDCSGMGTISTLLAGLDWILEDQKLSPRPGVVNMSLGGDASSALDAQVNRLVAEGLTTVVAAGNSNQDACMASPARVPGAITVGASTETDQRASFSNYGACVDVFAPGSNILSDSYTSPTATAVTSGTSASAPFVAGVAALCLEKYPDASPSAVEQTLLAQATSDVLGFVGDGSPNRLIFSLIGSLEEVAQTDSDGQLLSDPGFEYGTIFWSSDICSPTNPAGCPGVIDEGGWAGNGPDYALQSYPRSGKNHVTIGGPTRSFYIMSEAVTIPSTVRKAELSVYLWVVTKNKKKTADDILKVEVRDSAGALLTTLGTFSNLDANTTYAQRRFDVTSYRGATIRISFAGTQKQGPPTWFLLDDAALNIWH